MSAPRLHVADGLAAGAVFALPAVAARHLQVLRLQPGDAVTLFDGRGGEWAAQVARMGRGSVEVVVERHVAVERELARAVTIAVGMPANERMDALVEKATELGAAAIQPLVSERSVLRLEAERAQRRRTHWQAVAVAASEQSGRTRVPVVGPVLPLARWLAALDAPDMPDMPGARRVLLSPRAAQAWGTAALGAAGTALVVLSGPEGGLAEAEEAAAAAAGFRALSLGARVLRADTAPLAVLAWCALEEAG